MSYVGKFGCLGFLICLMSSCGSQSSSVKDFGPLDPCKYEPAALTVRYRGQVEEHTFDPPYGRGRCNKVVVDIYNLPLLGGVDAWMIPAAGAYESFYAYGRRLGDFEWFPIYYPTAPLATGDGPVLNRFVRFYGQQFAAGRLVVGAFMNGQQAQITVRVAPPGLVYPRP